MTFFLDIDVLTTNQTLCIMKLLLRAALFAILCQSVSFSQSIRDYYVPTHYQGIFHGQPSSARATGMGLTTITLEGIENAFYNPATIGLTEEKINVHINYASGSQVRKGGQYPFLGVSYRINNKLIVGISTLNWVDEKNSPWSTIIGGYEESYEDRRSQSAYTAVAAYEVIPGLNVGLSGNYLVGRAVPKNVTSTEFILSFGAIYDKEVDWIKNEKISNQNIRFATSLVNVLMKNRMEQTYQDFLNFRDLPIHLSFGAAYQATLAIQPNFTEGKGFFKGAPKTLDLAVHLQFRDVLPGPKETIKNANHENNTAFGIGAEAWFMKTLAFRLGYYFENRPASGPKEVGEGAWVTDNKRGLTWGFGANLPLNAWTKGKLPFNSEVNFVTSKVLNEYGNSFTVPQYFLDRSFLFSVGINLKFVDKNQN
ncbi:hypothetical protein GCM10011368_20800 [Hyunsoonleella pacifica]|nr:hypothetical protein GCM10011368_20800 [Hyunsoonleella pacifica]